MITTNTPFARAAHQLGANGHASWALGELADIWGPEAEAAWRYVLPYFAPCRQPEFHKKLIGACHERAQRLADLSGRSPGLDNSYLQQAGTVVAWADALINASLAVA